MIKLIRFAAFIVALVSFWSVYSRPEVRNVFLMNLGIETDGYEYEHDFERDDYDYDDDDDDDESDDDEYAYDDDDTDYDFE